MITDKLRAYYREIYAVNEAAGETIDVAIDKDGVAWVEIVKLPKGYATAVQVEIAFKKEEE